MPPKGQKGGAGGAKGKPKEEERENALQAVVLADSFENRFAPFTLEKPRCLLPLANAPLIEYTLEFLAHAGVEEIFVYCGAHTDQVEEYLNASKWKRSASPFTSIQLVRSAATSVGDVMRDMDSRAWITGDFLLITGDVVANVALEPALARHRARREKDKNAVMTMLLREAGAEHRTKPRRNQPIFVLAPKTDRCIWYDEIWQAKDAGRYLELDPEFFTEHAEIDIRSDLIDCHIDICTPEVLSLWSENFDFNTIRRGFLRGVLKDYELNGKTFHTHILKSGYAARVRDLRAYDAISRDIVARWTYPLTPDCNIFASQSYQLGKNKVYLEDGVSLARGSSIVRCSVVGRGTSVGINSIITDSIVGRGCHIGNNVTIRGAYVWSHAAIGDNSVIDGAIVGDEVSIGRHCIVTSGCLISCKVRIANNVQLPPNTRLTLAGKPAAKGKAADPLVGASGDGHAYDSPSSATSSPAASPLLAASRRSSSASVSSISTVHSQESPPPSRRPSAASQDRMLLGADVPGTSPESVILHSSAALGDRHAVQKARMRRDFLAEATASIYDGLVTREPADKIRLELVAQRLASDASDAAVRDAIVAAFLKRTWALINGDESAGTAAADSPAEQTEKLTPANAVSTVWSAKSYGWLLAQMGVFDMGTTTSAAASASATAATATTTAGGDGAALIKPDQVTVLRTIEASCADPARSKGREVLLFAVREGIEGNWLQAEGVEEWWAGPGAPAGSGKGDAPAVRGLVKTYVEYLQESSDEEEEDSDEEESEEEESE